MGVVSKFKAGLGKCLVSTGLVVGGWSLGLAVGWTNSSCLLGRAGFLGISRLVGLIGWFVASIELNFSRIVGDIFLFRLMVGGGLVGFGIDGGGLVGFDNSGFCFGFSWSGGCIVGEILSPSILLNFCSILDEILLFRLVGLLVGGWVVGWCWFGFGFSVLSPILSVFLCSTSHLIVFLFSTQSSRVLDGLAS